MPFMWADTRIRNSFQTSGAGRLADNRKISQEEARLSAAAGKSPFRIPHSPHAIIFPIHPASSSGVIAPTKAPMPDRVWAALRS